MTNAANEPTTGEIVRAFRGAGLYGITTALELRIIDRLESQERRIAELTEELEAISEAATVLHGANESRWNEIKELTARAEQAEAREMAAIAELDVIAQDGLCEVCFFGDFSEVSKDTCMEDCCFQWRNKKRGLEQERDGERCRVEF